MHTKVRGKVFKDLHSAEGIFVMPNAWSAGSACMLEEAGFPAAGTTSAGIAFGLGLPDYEGMLTREAALDETRRIARAVRIPVSVDAENGYGHTPEEVVETIRRVAETGAIGASIEDYAAAYGTGELYDRVLAVERIEAAAATAASLPFPFTLTARTECYLVGHPNPFGESVARATSYRDAGADCLYVPGIVDAETIGRLVKEVGAPVNVVMGLAGTPMSVSQLEDLGGQASEYRRVARPRHLRSHPPCGRRDPQSRHLWLRGGPGAGFRTLPVLCRPAGSNRSVTHFSSNLRYGPGQPSPSGSPALDCCQNGRP